MVMPSGFGEPSGSEAKRSTRPRSHAAASSGIRAKQASRNKAAREIADISPPQLLARPVCPSNAAASRRRPPKKNARLRKKSGVRAVTFYSGLASNSIVVFFVVVLFPMVALWEADQAALPRRVDGAVPAAGPQVYEDGVHVADGGRIADHVAEGPQLGDLGLVEACFAGDDFFTVVTEMRGASIACLIVMW